jgi:hypothetical protein
VAEGVFASIGSGAIPAPYKAKTVPTALLDRAARQGRNAYIVIRKADGTVIAKTTGAPASATGPVRKDLAPAFSGKAPSFFSGVIPGRPATVQWAIAYKAADGSPRVQVVGIPAAAMGKFLGDFLSRLPNSSSATAAVLDPAGLVVGSPDKGVADGRMYADHTLVQAARGGTSGGLGDRYFASSPLTGSTWRVVIAAPNGKLYQSINGARRTIPWLMLVILALVGLAGLYALRRAALAQAEVYRRSISRQTALEINDNVIQRLAIVKFALERGQEAQTQEKVAEALQEAQRLVNQLLGEEGTEAGSLRRTTDSPKNVL